MTRLFDDIDPRPAPKAPAFTVSATATHTNGTIPMIADPLCGNESQNLASGQRVTSSRPSDSKSAAARRASSSLAEGTIGKSEVSSHSRPQNFRIVSASSQLAWGAP